MSTKPDPQFVNGLLHAAIIDEVKASPFYHPAPHPSGVDFFWSLRKINSADCYGMGEDDIRELANRVSKRACATLAIKPVVYSNGHKVTDLKTLNDVKGMIFQSIKGQEKW